jgi:hypothetical protein
MILADDGYGRDDARAAARLVGLAAMPEVGWVDAAEELAGAVPAVLIVEASGVEDGSLVRGLPAIATLATQATTAIVVTLDAAQIDLVSAFLLGDRVQLLCEPTLADRAAALVVARASGDGGRLRDPLGSSDAERLATLAGEVTRIGAALAELANRRHVEPSLADRTDTYSAPPPERATTHVTAAELRIAIRGRRLRDAAFGPGWFEDPAWDMLLDLFAAELEGTQVSVSSLCIAAAVAPTTALRWITKMTAAGLLLRRNDARDRRRAFMQLSDRARAGLLHYVAASKQAGAPIV